MSQLEKVSPAMQHYLDMKEKYRDCILFYRLGDFYEMFFDDAKIVSKELDLILTAKSCGLKEKAPMCGVPFHAANVYIQKLISAGYKVAICEQLSEPKPGKNLIDRDVVQIVTPGTVTDSQMLDEKRNNYLLSLFVEGAKAAAAYVDVSTGEFEAVDLSENTQSTLSDLLTRIEPCEVLACAPAKELYDSLPMQRLGTLPKCQVYYEWAYSLSRAKENMAQQLGENFETVFELAKKPHIISASGAILEYIKETQKRTLKNINRIKVLKDSSYLVIDASTRRNLELVESMRERKRYGSLLWLMDKTKTCMGARGLRKMFDQPLTSTREINLRLDSVQELTQKLILRDSLTEILGGVSDIERLSCKVASSSIYPKEVLSIKNTLQAIPKIKESLACVDSLLLQEIRDSLPDFEALADLLDKAIEPELLPATMKDGGYIRAGFNDELDDFRAAKEKGKEWIVELEAREREETGIKNLKIDCNKVFGYFIEVNRSQIGLVPLRYERKQTIANNERYITQELKDIEDKIFGSDEKAIKLEALLFGKIREYLQGYVQKLQDAAKAIAMLDALLSLSTCAVKYNFVKPTINKDIKHIKIEEGRHPVVEAFTKSGAFVPNDTFLDEEGSRTMIITGPNMAGKSTYMRQVAVITFLAHIGSFVPAKSAEIAITDRIFTRVGASDDLALGQSTFMVEMSEVALILAGATNKSLIILDEIGRGTSTFDGLSIAWAVVEYLSSFHAKTLFATHYHELTDLEGVIDGVKNYKVSVKEIDDSVVFLRKIVRGGANKSFGIEVARLAGVPEQVILRAKEISKSLEKVSLRVQPHTEDQQQKEAADTKKALSLLSRIRDIDINRLSPMAAFDLVCQLCEESKKETE